MTEIEALLDEFTNEYKQQKSKLKVLKNGAITSVFTGFCYGSTRIFGKVFHNKFTFLNIIGIEVFLFLLIMLPVILAPLYIFLDENIQSSIKTKIKSSIFKNTLDKYNLSYKICVKSTLPEIDIQNLGYEKRVLQFSYGDDLIIGEFNEMIKFRISEIHSSTLISKKFDGLVGVLIFSNSESLNNKFNLLHNQNSTEFELKKVSNKIYISMYGENSHFEFKFKREKPNVDKLLRDKRLFEGLCVKMFT